MPRRKSAIAFPGNVNVWHDGYQCFVVHSANCRQDFFFHFADHYGK